MSTLVHHLNCATLRPATSFRGRLTPPRMVAHVLLVERPNGLVLVDSGFGTCDIALPARLGRLFVAGMRPSLDLAEAAVTQVERLGHRATDVRDVVLTHLDLDHAGGLGDFPHARVHVYDAELAAARRPQSLLEKRRYVQAQWAHGPRWVEHHTAGDDWFGFAAVTALADDVVMVPLRGHSRGHCGVAVRRPDGGWLLHAGDAYFFRGEVEDPPSHSRGLSTFQKVMSSDEQARRANQERLRELRSGHPDVEVFSAHDAGELDRLAAARTGRA